MNVVKSLIDRLGLPEDKPVIPAAIAAVIYVLVALFYIIVSGRIAANYAVSVDQLQTIETIKGKVFIVVTGMLFFAVSYGWWKTTHDQRRLLVDSERREVACMYSATLAHDLNNMLMALYGLLEGLKKHEQGNKSLIALRKTTESSINNLASLSKRIASSARQLETQGTSTVCLSEILPVAVDLARKHPDVHHCKIKTGDFLPCALRLDKALFELAILNLIINAAHAAGPDGSIEVLTEWINGKLSLQVHDDGPGIPLDQREAVLRAGFSTKSNGSGLGMLSVQAFAATANAKICIGDSHLGGCRIEFVFRNGKNDAHQTLGADSGTVAAGEFSTPSC